jgi:hypothetical protein
MIPAVWKRRDRGIKRGTECRIWFSGTSCCSNNESSMPMSPTTRSNAQIRLADVQKDFTPLARLIKAKMFVKSSAPACSKSSARADRRCGSSRRALMCRPQFAYLGRGCRSAPSRQAEGPPWPSTEDEAASAGNCRASTTEDHGIWIERAFRLPTFELLALAILHACKHGCTNTRLEALA